MWIKLLYFAQTLIWMRGILQLPVRREKKYYALAATVLAAFFIWGYTVGYGGNDAIVWMGAEYLLMLLLFAKRAGELLIKYLFAFCYIGMLSEPIRMIFSVFLRFHMMKWEKTVYETLLDGLLVLLSLLVALWLKRRGDLRVWIEKLPVKYYGIGFLAGFCASAVGSFSKTMMEDMPDRAFLFYRVVSTALEEMVYLSGIFIAYLADLNRRYRKESALKGELLVQARKHFITLEQQMEKTRKIRHDMRFHLRTIQNCLLEGRDREGLSYLETVIGRIEAGKHGTPDVGNQMVNAVLEGELAQMPEEMTLECQGALRPDLQVEDFDLCTIFANLISNAREACERLEHTEKRIELNLKQYQKYQIIEVKNPVEWEVEIEKIGQYTSKKEGEDHGLGLLNVIETVERNGGTIKFASKEGIFRVLIQLKSGRKEKERNSERG